MRPTMLIVYHLSHVDMNSPELFHGMAITYKLPRKEKKENVISS